MRIGLDATPLIGERTGIGHWTEQVIRALCEAPDPPEVRLVPFTWRGAEALPDASEFGPRVTASRRRAPARLLREIWARSDWPPVEMLAGPLDVFHATNFVLPPTRRAAGVLTVHDLTYLHHPEWVQPDVARYADLVPRGLRHARAVTTLTETVRAELLDTYRLDGDRVVVAAAAVDAARFDVPVPGPADRRGLGVPDDYVLFLGTREPRKGLGVLLGAYRELLAEGVEVLPLVVAGGSGWGAQPDESALPVTSLGYVDRAALPALLAGARLLAFPSFYEGFGMPPLEALAAGTAVLASDIPVLREVLSEAAAFAPAGDVSGWAAELRHAFDAPRDEATRQARRHAALRYTWTDTGAAVRRAYDVALSS